MKVNKKGRRIGKKRALQFRWQGILISLILFSVFYFIFVRQFAFYDITPECDELYKVVKKKISERNLAFVEIEKSVSEKNFFFVRYKDIKVSLAVKDGIAVNKFAIGFLEGLPEHIWAKCNESEGEVKVFYYISKLKIGVLAIKGGMQHATVKSVDLGDYSGGKIAIVIDDTGNTDRWEEYCFSLDNITLSILPKLRYSKYFAERAANRGFGVMLHLPLEAKNRSLNLGPGGIKSGMDKSEILRILREDIESVGTPCGVNNHMGSLVTANKKIMRIILKELKKRGLFFLDSYTSTDSVVADVAKELKMKYIRRDIFIDNNDNIEYIKGQLEKGIEIAKNKGVAVLIGHYRKNTFKAIVGMKSIFEENNIQLVKVEELYR